MPSLEERVGRTRFGGGKLVKVMRGAGSPASRKMKANIRRVQECVHFHFSNLPKKSDADVFRHIQKFQPCF
jgi:hypothetical protein